MLLLINNLRYTPASFRDRVEKLNEGGNRVYKMFDFTKYREVKLDHPGR